MRAAKPTVTRTTRHLAWLALLLTTLPGCLTNIAWQKMGAQPWQRTLTSSRHLPSDVAAHVVPADHTILLATKPPMQLRAQHLGQTGAALLIRPELFEVATAQIHGQRTRMHGETEHNQMHLLVKGAVRADAWRTVLADRDVPADVETQLLRGLPQPLGLPEELVLCAQRLHHAKLHLLAPDITADAKLLSYTFTDTADELILPAPDITTFENHFLHYPDHRRVLQSARLYARIADRRGVRTLRIEPDAFFVISDLDADDDGTRLAVRRSRWALGDAPSATGGDTTEWKRAEHVTCDVRDNLVEPRQTPVATRIGQVALTPITLVADLIYTPVALLVTWIVW